MAKKSIGRAVLDAVTDYSVGAAVCGAGAGLAVAGAEIQSVSNEFGGPTVMFILAGLMSANAVTNIIKSQLRTKRLEEENDRLQLELLR